ncbi:MAG: A/G-specific adenine glycosylase [Gammaproteobacteria bacterium]|nr:MAG: A/G-specific adenine glycosylase [Gammaproteobacteria bacterium]
MNWHSASTFHQAVLGWFDHHGRKDLPWQKNITPYRVWVSEIMLQQTQVNTVIPYFERFISSFPTAQALATANQDSVLQHWTGLGYYARARNLHKAANQIWQNYQGEFPQSVEKLTELPGIGKSTAGAIAAISMGIHAPILDGNVKRVLARYHRIQGWPGQSATLKKLWSAAEHYTPRDRVADYTQAMMDLGATLCTRSRPKCQQCPLNPHCEGLAMGDALDYPHSKPKKAIPTKATNMLLIENSTGELLLVKRPPAGIWGGLWSFLEAPDNIKGPCNALNKAALEARIGTTIESITTWEVIKHTFSHYHLMITPIHIRISIPPKSIMEGEQQIWYNPLHPADFGLAAPVARLLKQLLDNRFEHLKGTHHHG